MSEKILIINEMAKLINSFLIKETKPIICKNCGYILLLEDLFCNRCGKKIDSNKPTIRSVKLFS